MKSNIKNVEEPKKSVNELLTEILLGTEYLLKTTPYVKGGN